MVVDAGNAGKHARQHFVSHAPDTYIFIDNWAAVGAGFPTALGAALARPGVPMLAVQGDMGFMCNIGELETAVREKIKVVAVVINDEGLGNERAFAAEGPAVIDVLIDKGRLAPVLFTP